jgi:hypothetical protein
MSAAPAPVEAEFTLLRNQFEGVRLRKATRYRCGLATLCYVIYPEDGRREEAWASNLSEAGIGFIHCRSLEPGTALRLRLRGAQGQSIIIESRVAHATLQNDGSWCIGCSFDQQISVEMLDELL